jgi:shikimate kinase
MDKNIVLIGMSGAGKTTIGKALSSILNKQLVDIDEYIESTQGEAISEIFKMGECHFREIESQAVENIAKLVNCIISTGGGVIKKEENMFQLKQNGIIFFIDRPIEKIAEDIDDSKRPLIKNNKANLYELHKLRYPLYIKYSDYVIYNEVSEENVIDKILKILEQSQ